MMQFSALFLALLPMQDLRISVAETLDDFHLAASQADSERYFGHFAVGAVFLGTDAGERWSVEEFRGYAEPYFNKGQGWTYVASERHIRMGPDNRSAWFDERLQNVKYGEVRGSGVLQLEGERWKVAQYNLSFPVPNDDSPGMTAKAIQREAVGDARAKEFLVKDGDRTLVLWNKVVPSQLDLDPRQRPVVVLLPSATFSARGTWDFSLRDYSVMDAMASRGFDVFAVELGGYGASSPPDDNPQGGHESAVRDLSLCLDFIAEQRGITQVVLVGPSWGSQVAASFAAKHPARLRGVVLYGYRWKSRFPEDLVREIYGASVIEDRTRPVTEAAATGDFEFDQFEEDVPAAFSKHLLSQGASVPTGSLLDYVRELPVAQPAELALPTLMLYGRGEFNPPKEAGAEHQARSQAHRAEQREFYRQLPEAKHWIEVPGAGHSAHLDRPHVLFQRCLIGWIERL